MCREMFCQPLHDQLFGALIGLRNQIHFAFVGDLRRVPKLFAQHRTSFPCNLDGRSKIARVAHRPSCRLLAAFVGAQHAAPQLAQA